VTGSRHRNIAARASKAAHYRVAWLAALGNNPVNPARLHGLHVTTAFIKAAMETLTTFFNKVILPFFNQYIEPWLDKQFIPLFGKIVVALAIFLVGKWVTQKISNILLRVMQKSKMENTLAKFLHNLSYWFLLIAVVLSAVQALGVPFTSLLAAVGAAGLAVGLALKDSLSNFAAGVMIILFRPFKVGDTITASSSTGVVEEIGMFCTLLNTPDNQRIVIPNSTIIGSTIVNATTLPTRRVDLIFGISLEANIATAKAVIDQVLSQEPRLLAEPAPSVGVDKLTDSTIDLFVRPWVKTSDYWDVRATLQEKIKTAMDAAGIVIPFRQHTVYLPAAKATSQQLNNDSSS
jgi:small conductance mechanosensitive channel